MSSRNERTALVTPSKTTELGDVVEAALRTMGVTHERVERWLGRPCGCEERREKLNRLSRWARRMLKHGMTRDYLEEMLSE